MRGLPSLTLLASLVLVYRSHKVMARLSFRGSVVTGNVDTERQTRSLDEITCRITTLRVTSNDSKEFEDVVCIPLISGSGRDKLFSLELPSLVLSNNREAIARGKLVVRIANIDVDDENDRIIINQHSRVEVERKPEPFARRSLQGQAGEEMKTNGTQSLMIVRVSTRDASPQMTLLELEDSVFGIHRVSAVSQYRDCSFGQLVFEKLPSLDLVLANFSISDFNDGSQLLGLARSQMAADLGLESIDDVADRIIFCMASTKSNGRDWVARTAVNHYRVVINGDYCHYLHVKLHELGHAIGLYHAGRGSEYGDLTCNMGGTTPDGNSTFPQKCFNALHHYQLGWYSSHHMTIDPLNGSEATHRITLIAFVDFDKAQTSGEAVIVNIANRYFLQFNRAALFNRETQDMANRVVINEDLGTRSDLLAGLTLGEEFAIQNFTQSGSTLRIKVCEHVNGSDSRAEAMILSITTLGEEVC